MKREILNEFYGTVFLFIGFEVFIPKNNQSQFRLPSINSELISHEIIVDKNDNSYMNLPMMFIDTKSLSTTTKSLILVEQSINLTSIQTANVTVIFNHRVSNVFVIRNQSRR